ncbi:hypothetical protein BWQ96_08696 [Gracilariopsis chorda]|uniref:Uncharacterized protein n=1 Tax=Gracilariopsis chorda TaxID=448386 RepID=A0A2V3IHN4_9FLOR|nr:hypothetical protein BWQ96_08696 [Gracilariopsis chorda]|eukprot:PXF41582.1 hypothetical protein BWQ96_08696 [Gracilariopsis chorda]
MDEAKKIFPAVPEWLINLELTHHLPFPMAPVAWYYHRRLAAPASPEENAKFDYYFEVETCALVAAIWWNEACHGGRQILLNARTVRYLEARCQQMVIDPKLATGTIIHMMQAAVSVHPAYRWRVSSGLKGFQSSHYVECDVGTGALQQRPREGRLVFADVRSRRLRLVTREAHRRAIAHSSPMALQCSLEDVLEVDGLKQFLDERGWGRDGLLSVKELLTMFLQDLRRSERDLDGVLREMRALMDEQDRAAARHGREPAATHREGGSGIGYYERGDHRENWGNEQYWRDGHWNQDERARRATRDSGYERGHTYPRREERGHEQRDAQTMRNNGYQPAYAVTQRMRAIRDGTQHGRFETEKSRIGYGYYERGDRR